METVAQRMGEAPGAQEIAIDRWNRTALNTTVQEEGGVINQSELGFASIAAKAGAEV